MAERRMFAKTIVDSDAFLDMPLSTQALYFHLSMRADDDGFINNPKKLQRMIGCADDDLKLLLAKRFLIPFDSGIVVIKHWKIHNYIQKDRYKPTMYQEEKALLDTKENKSYTINKHIPEALDTDCIHDVSRMDTQVRLGKDRLDKVNNYYSGGSDTEFTDIVKLYSENIELPNQLTSDWIIDTLNDFGYEWFKNAIIIANENGKRKQSYIKGILDNWKTNGGMKLAKDKPSKTNYTYNMDDLEKKVWEKQVSEVKEVNPC